MKSIRWAIPVMLAVAALANCQGQGAMHWTAFKSSDGLSEPAYDGVAVTPQGSVIATRSKAPMAADLDGYSVSNIPVPASHWGRIRESPAGQRWALVPHGLMEFKNGDWVLRPVAEVSAAFRAGEFSATNAPAFLPVRQGTVLILLPGSLTEFSSEIPDQPRTISLWSANRTPIGAFRGMAVTRNNNLWVAGAHGLAKAVGPVRNLESATRWEEFVPPESLRLCNFEEPMPDSDGLTVIGESETNGQKMVARLDGHGWRVLPSGGRAFFRAWCEPDGTPWAATAQSLFQWVAARTNWVTCDDLALNHISDVALEPGGAFWLATSDGLIRGMLSVWSKPQAFRDLDAPVECMAVDAGGGVWFIADNKLFRFQDLQREAYSLPPGTETAPAASTLLPLKDGSLLVGKGDGVFRFTPAAGFSPVPLPGPAACFKPLGLLADGGVCLFCGGAHPSFLVYDGVRTTPWANPPPVPAGEVPLTLRAARNGDVWIGGNRSVYWSHDGAWRQFVSDDHASPEGVGSFLEMTDGRIWAATAAELWSFDGSKWSAFPNRFNHINSLLLGRDGRAWLASDGGLYLYARGGWLENGAEEGLPAGAVLSLGDDPRGNLWVGRTHGLALGRPDSDPSPPRTTIRWFGGNDHRLAEREILNVWFEGKDKWNVTLRDRLLYSCQLDQHGWSAFQDLSMFSVTGLAAGRHYFQVRAMDRLGNVDPMAAALDFMVVAPWFRETRLWVILLLGLAAALFFAALAWNRHRQLVRSYAAVEQKVAERTRELEIATRELLQSQKMNALGTLAAGIAHDFNNILSIIKGSAQIIEDNPDQPEKIRTRVARIKTVVQQGAEIVDAMLGFGRGSDAVAPCDLNAVVADTLRLLGDRFLAKADFRFAAVESLPEVVAPRELIQQILLNFIFNAVESMNTRGKIVLTAGCAASLPADLVLSPVVATSYVLVSVQDEGVGIAPENRARIFEPFFTTKAMSVKRGTGLGLSMVYELAKKMGAGLAVESVEGKGSRFTLILAVPAQPAAPQPPLQPFESTHP